MQIILSILLVLIWAVLGYVQASRGNWVFILSYAIMLYFLHALMEEIKVWILRCAQDDKKK